MLPLQIASVVALLAVTWFFSAPALRKAAARKASVQPGLDALRAAFAQTRGPDEHEPVCVVAFHHVMLNATPVIVGVTNRRVLVLKGGGPMQAFPYDHEGEHLPSDQKTAQGRGFFRWSHDAKGYCPTVNVPPFRGEEWRMYPVLPAYRDQKENLREFSQRFYFRWFYP